MGGRTGTSPPEGGVMFIILGILVVFVIAVVLFLVIGLCEVAHKSDEASDEMLKEYEKRLMRKALDKNR